jgi:hypothetical protein
MKHKKIYVETYNFEKHNVTMVSAYIINSWESWSTRSMHITVTHDITNNTWKQKNFLPHHDHY